MTINSVRGHGGPSRRCCQGGTGSCVSYATRLLFSGDPLSPATPSMSYAQLRWSTSPATIASSGLTATGTFPVYVLSGNSSSGSMTSIRRPYQSIRAASHSPEFRGRAGRSVPKIVRSGARTSGCPLVASGKLIVIDYERVDQRCHHDQIDSRLAMHALLGCRLQDLRPCRRLLAHSSRPSSLGRWIAPPADCSRS